MCTYEVGDVLHYHHQVYATKDVWVVVISKTPPRAFQIKGCFSQPMDRSVNIGSPGASIGAKRRVVPPDEWPDDVCVAVAKWRLTHDRL